MDIAVLVVIYNMNCSDVKSLKSLVKMGDKGPSQILVFDNSTIENQNESFCIEQGFTYFSEGKNVGLSKAYLKGIKALKENGFTGYLCLLDDDSQIENDFFEAVKKEIEETNCDVLLPIVRTKEKILSPCVNNRFGITRAFKDKNELKHCQLKYLTAINSGMVVKMSVYETCPYNEKLFLDGIDHDFMYCAKKQNKKIHIMDYVLMHEFSEEVIHDKESAFARYQILASDMKNVAGCGLFTYGILVGKRALRLDKEFHTNIFMKEFIHKFFKRKSSL